MSVRRYSEYAQRNSGPIGLALSARLPARAHVLEIASGSGQHSAAFARRLGDVQWYTSDYDSDNFASISDWRAEVSNRIHPPQRIDVTAEAWWDSAPEAINVIYCANMIHIAPLEALNGLAKGAGEILSRGQALYLYGPFLFGDDSAPSNRAFSARLKGRDPRWGVRECADVKQIFAINHLSFTEQITMPANNHILVFHKTL